MLQSGFRFSRQEEKVLALSMSGLSDKEIAQRMEIGLGTVRTFWKRIRSKAGGSTRAEVIGAITRVAADQEFEVAEEQNVHLIAEFARRQAAEEAARRREREFAVLAEVVPAAVFSVTDGDIDLVNEAAAEWAGTNEPEPALQCRWVHPDDRESVRKEWLRCSQERTAFETECRIRFHDGTYRACRVKAIPSGDGVQDRWIGSLTDLQEYAEMDAVNRSLARGSGEAVLLLDPSGGIQGANEEASALMGMTASELGDKSVADLDPLGPEGPFATAFADLPNTGKWSGRLHLRTTHRQDLAFECRMERLEHLQRSLLIARQATNEPLSESVYAEAFHRARTGIGIVEPDGKLVAANERFTELVGYQPRTIEGVRLESLVTFSDRKRLETLIHRADAEGDAQAGISLMHANGGLVPMLADVSSIVEDGVVKRRIVTVRRTADTSRRY